MPTIYKLPGGVEDLTFGVGTEQQQRQGTIVQITQINGAYIPYSSTQSINEKVDQVDAKFEGVRVGLDNHLADKENPHDVTPGQIDAADKVHTHTISDVENLQDTLNNKSNVGHSHNIDDVTGLQSALDSKADDGDSYLKTEHVLIGGVPEAAGKPIVLNGNGELDPSISGKGLYLVGMFTPTAGAEYPDPTGEETGAYWGIMGVDGTNGYTFTGGDLVGETIYNNDAIVNGSQGWGIFHVEFSTNEFYKRDGSLALTGALAGGGQQAKNFAGATEVGDLVEYSQVNQLATLFLRLDGTLPMTGNLDFGSYRGINLEEGIDATDAVNLTQLNTKEPVVPLGAAGQLWATNASGSAKEWIDPPITLPDATGKAFNELATDGSAADAAAWSPFRLSPKTIGFNATIATGSNATIGSFTLEDTYTITVEDGGTLIVV